MCLALLGALLLSLGCVPDIRGDGSAAGRSGDYEARWQFPANVADFKRVSFEHEPGKQVIAGYNLDALSRVVLTLYVYKVGGVTSVGSSQAVRDTATEIATKQQFEAEQGAIIQARGQSLAPVQTGTVRFSSSGVSHEMLSARFQFREPFGGKTREIDSLLYYTRDGEWAVKYRITFPTDQRAEAEAAVQKFLSELEWPAN